MSQTKKTEILSLPKIQFAHAFEADKYSHCFSANNSFIEITYLKQGETTLIQDNKVYTAHEGDIICILPGSEIAVKNDSFHCHHTVGADVLWTQTDSANALHLPLITRASAATEEITALIDSFIYDPCLYNDSYAKAATVFMNILCKINSIYLESEASVPGSVHMLSIRAKKYIHENLHKGITQTEVAGYLGITPQYLCNVFKKSEGISLIRYINTVKLKGIQSIMEKENLKLYEAAQLFGYSDANYVSFLYKKMFGRNITDKPNFMKEIKQASE